MLSIGAGKHNSLRVLAGVGALLLVSALAAAQEAAPPAPATAATPAPVAAPAPPPAPAETQEPGFFGQVGRWFDRQVSGMHSMVEGAGRQVKNFGREAGVAAETTAGNARQAADVVAKIPNARMVMGHQECAPASNGAPDCVSAATALCKAKGFKAGTSMAMTSATKCPPEVYLAGRSNGAGCSDMTFVSQALCQ